MISIVIPCYNEARIIQKSLDKVIEFMSSTDLDYELILVNDGSGDNTEKVLNEYTLKHVNIKVYSYKENKGKGYAINYGLKHCKGDTIIFMDADLSTDLTAIKNALDIIYNTAGRYLIIGSRKMKGSVILNNNNKMRKIMSKCCTVLVNKIFDLDVTDSQCGFKCFDSNTKDSILEKQSVFRWAFDVEYILIAKKIGTPVIEMPVTWEYKRESSVRFIKSSLEYLSELLKIKQLHGDIK